ncbi:hypothetical protein D0N87_30040, partial [Pseudomonas sp. ATCC 13867]
CLGLGFLWMLWDKNKRTWHDRYSESVVIQIPKAVRKTTQGRGLISRHEKSRQLPAFCFL